MAVFTHHKKYTKFRAEKQSEKDKNSQDLEASKTRKMDVYQFTAKLRRILWTLSGL